MDSQRKLEMSVPVISVVMTVFNSERYVREAVESILGQTFKDFEFIIVDNASTDQTPDIIKSFQDPRVIYVRNQENLGQTRSLNIGIKMARGEFVARMDADDISLPERLEKQYRYLEAHPEIAVVGAQFWEMNDEGRILRRFYLPTDPLEIKCYLIGASELSYHCVPHPIVLMRKAALLDVGLYNESFIAQDYDLWVKLSRKYLFANLSGILFKYRIAKSAQTRRFQNVFREDCGRSIRGNIRSYLPQLPLADVRDLGRMLNFLPQRSGQNGQKVLGHFDHLFDTMMADYAGLEIVGNLKEKIKFYYLSQLFLTNPFQALKVGLGILIRQPQLLVDWKALSKVIKVATQLFRGTVSYGK